MSKTLRGHPACPGLARGPMHVVDRAHVVVPRYRVGPKQRKAELQRFEQSVVQSEEQLEALALKAEEGNMEQVSTLLRAHAMILRDAAFYEATQRRILEDGQNAEWALRSTVREVRRLFQQMEKDFFRERRSDVDVVADRVLRNLTGAAADPLADIPNGAVVVAHDLSPADTLALARERVAGFVTATGGRTSHTAILARALQVPCVVGVHGLHDEVEAGENMIVDGGSGVVVVAPEPEDVRRFEVLERRRAEEERALLVDREVPAATLDGVRIELLGNVEVLREAEVVLQMGGEGIGLLRTEFLGLEGLDFDDPDAQAEAYAQVVRALDGRTVTIRTFDTGGDKSDSSESSSVWATDDLGATTNGPLGLRAIRFSLRQRDAFRVQIESVLRAAAHGPVRLMVPFVSDLEEIRQAKQEVEAARERLGWTNGAGPNVAFGMMVETPAAVSCLDLFEQEVDFFSVGTNDLIQFVMAADRSEESVAYLVRPCQPAVLRTLAEVGRRARIPTTICGELAADPFLAPLLLGMGYRSLSMGPASIPVVKRMIRRLDRGRCQSLADRCLRLGTADAIEAQVAEALSSWVPELVGGERFST
ncbi:MAG: phosphoenolpyruvate--protein phosphotransferase [Myxococcota bacterium]